MIQLLDDSDQKTISLSIQEYIENKKDKFPDLHIFYLHRDHRHSYKAGNLNFGLSQLSLMIPAFDSFAPDQIIVSIFDADYLINRNYLKKITPYFWAHNVGIVQTATTFRNSTANRITRAQGIFQDNIHYDELSLRSQADQLSMFRGSAGSLRLSTIMDCDYWHGDTQIEDTDLSFDAQCRGWKVLYDDQIINSSLLPERYIEFKLQQRSWMKGLMEVMRKQLGPILTSQHLRYGQKFLAIDFFLILSLQALFMIVTHLTFIPAYHFWCSIATPMSLNILFLFFLTLLILTHIPFFTQARGSGPSFSILDRLYAFILMTSMFSTFSYGLLEGLLGVSVHRHRTGKGDEAGDAATTSLPQQSIQLLRNINTVEIILALYSIIFVFWAFIKNEYIIFSAYSITAIIYPLNALYSLWNIRRVSKNLDRVY